MSITDNERAEMCDLFASVGPDAPTLCEGWNTSDLLAHLLVRERRPDAAAGIAVPFLRKHAADVMESFTAAQLSVPPDRHPQHCAGGQQA